MQQLLRGLDFLHKNWVLHRCAYCYEYIIYCIYVCSLVNILYVYVCLYIKYACVNTHLHTHVCTRNNRDLKPDNLLLTAKGTSLHSLARSRSRGGGGRKTLVASDTPLKYAAHGHPLTV